MYHPGLFEHDGLSEYSFADTEALTNRVLKSFKPPEKISCADWSEKHRRLSPESSAMPGKFRFDKTPYMREPYEMVGKPGVISIAMMCSAQVAKSTFVENVLAYYIDIDPCPILHISPTLDSMKMFSKERLAPMIRDTPKLRNKIQDARTRDSGNTIANKKFPGGHIAMVGSNSPAGLASRPIRILLADEVDRFERSAGTEGDPLLLGIKRTTTYWNRVLIFVSTPGDKYNPEEQTGSRIEKEFLDGDQRHYWAECPHCHEKQKMKWSQVQWDTDEDGNHDAMTAMYACEHNGCLWNDLDREYAMLNGEWRAEKPFNGKVSYCLSQLHSLFAPLHAGVSDFLSSRSDPMLMKTWVNTFLGEPWEDKGVRLEWSNLKDQRSDYERHDAIPEEVTVITCAVDVQDDRLEYEILGWDEDYRTWSLEYGKFEAKSNLIENQPWIDLSNKLKRTFMHPIFGEMAIRNTAIDSGGHFTQKVYKFCEFRPTVQAIKGVGGAGKPFVGRRIKNTIGNAVVYPLGVDTIKGTVVARLKVNDPSEPGYCHFPMEYDDDYFKMLTAEELKTTFKMGKRKQAWVQIRKRNEAFDIRVYNHAALAMIGINLNSERRKLLRLAEKRVIAKKKKPKPRNRKQSNWAEDWKNG